MSVYIRYMPDNLRNVPKIVLISRKKLYFCLMCFFSDNKEHLFSGKRIACTGQKMKGSYTSLCKIPNEHQTNGEKLLTYVYTFQEHYRNADEIVEESGLLFWLSVPNEDVISVPAYAPAPHVPSGQFPHRR
jgi:hypothetical protein